MVQSSVFFLWYFHLKSYWQIFTWARNKWLTQPCKVMKYIKHRLLYSKTSLFIDRPHLVTCHNIHRSETKLTFKALSLTYKCRGRVGPGGPASCPLCEPPAAKRCEEHSRPDTVLFSSSLPFFRLRSHTSQKLADRRRPSRASHAYIICSLCRDETRGSFRVWCPPQAFSIWQETEEDKEDAAL